MATIRNTGPGAVQIPALGLDVAEGDTFECPDGVAAELVLRPHFEAPRPSKAKTTKTTKPVSGLRATDTESEED